jgi:hypothetical protein
MGMRSGLSFDTIFPVRSDASARLMRLKADCLFEAGVIDAEERSAVYARTRSVLRDVRAPALCAATGEGQPAALAY